MADAARNQHPIQVFLDTNQFIRVERKPAGGGNKDFFAGDDAGFNRHKTQVRQQITDIAEAMEIEGQAAGFLIVQMREDALAKSYRPLTALFTPNHRFALVGGGKPGEMFFQTTPQGLRHLDVLIDERAELRPREVYNEKTGKIDLRVSAYRSELGGIHSIRTPGPADRIQFSAREAVDWLQRPGVFGGYLVEFFRPDWTIEAEAVQRALTTFKHRLASFEGGLVALPIVRRTKGEGRNLSPAITIQLVTEPERKQLLLPLRGEEPKEEDVVAALEELRENPQSRDFSIERHQNLLDLLASEPTVQSVELPPVIEVTPAGEAADGEEVRVPEPAPGRRHAVVGILDGGVTRLPSLASWRVGQADIIDPADRDENHGTFIAGLLAGARQLNPHIEHTLERHGCQFFDLDIVPRRGLLNKYYATLPEFLDQLETLVEKAKAEANVRVFNLSLGIPRGRGHTDYSYFAAVLDEIALRNDVVFVVSAGNLEGLEARPPWPGDGQSAVEMLAARPPDGEAMTAPADHLLGFTVGAVNPPGIDGHQPDVPTTYSRRGPGAGSARKPELCHYGGARPARGNRTGLHSLSDDGTAVDNRGTSFAAPLVAATVASIDNVLEGKVPREILMALPVHRARRCPMMTQKPLRHISRDFVGFGMAPSAEACLADSPYAVTLVFSGVLKARRELEFVFTWPRSLVLPGGKCKGQVDITLAFTPPIDPQFHAECLRARLEAYLYQLETDPETGEEKPQSQLKLEDSGLPQHLEYTERYLVENGLKWTPIKRYHLPMPLGRGKSSDWRLSLKSYTRAAAVYPEDGVPFTVIMTISDPTEKAAIFEEVRNEVIRRGLRLADITVAHRVRV